jgi:16S rRNA (cytosine1402-N4)-methyltransferase
MNDKNTSVDASPPYHVPVLFFEALEALQVKAKGIYVDCTFGGEGIVRVFWKSWEARGNLLPSTRMQMH